MGVLSVIIGTAKLSYRFECTWCYVPTDLLMGANRFY